eukprot:12176686-Alexandrium_andersonii.AAC.1
MLADGATHPAQVLGRVAQGRRASTLRRRAQDWERFRRYLAVTAGEVWPHSVGDVIGYIEALEEGGATPSAFDNF